MSNTNYYRTYFDIPGSNSYEKRDWIMVNVPRANVKGRQRLLDIITSHGVRFNFSNKKKSPKKSKKSPKKSKKKSKKGPKKSKK